MSGTDTSLRISFLGTGTELITGDVLETNCRYFASIINENGGNINLHVQVSDKLADIKEALAFLLSTSDTVIITGGLGPTSDDTTRFAMAEVIDDTLIFHEAAWDHIVKRLNRFQIPVNESNRQQALFPAHAELYENDHGTAYGCHLIWNGKHIFMLPGPPRECRPMFDRYILPALTSGGYFSEKSTVRWMTFGLSEGEIAPKIDALAAAYPVEVGFRWHYPFIEIKVICENQTTISPLIDSIENLLKPNIVSHSSKDALALLKETFPQVSSTFYLQDQATHGLLAKELHFPNLNFVDTPPTGSDGIFVTIKTDKNILQQNDYSGMITFECNARQHEQPIYSHIIKVANRGPEIIECAKSYIAWQLLRILAL